MTAKETLNLVSKQWCSLKDLMKLAGVGRNTALTIKSAIKSTSLTSGFWLRPIRPYTGGSHMRAF